MNSYFLPLNNWGQDNTRKGDQHRWFLSLYCPDPSSVFFFFLSVFYSWVQFYGICWFDLNLSSQKHLLIWLIWCTTRTQKSGKCVTRPWTSSWYFFFNDNWKISFILIGYLNRIYAQSYLFIAFLWEGKFLYFLFGNTLSARDLDRSTLCAFLTMLWAAFHLPPYFHILQIPMGLQYCWC